MAGTEYRMDGLDEWEQELARALSLIHIYIAAKLTDMGFQTLAPVENRPVRSGGAWGTKEYVLFPGYVFLQMDYNAGNYYRLKAVPGIVKLLSGTLTYLEAEWIRLLAGQGGIPLEPTLVRETEGGLEIETGILQNFKSRIIRMDKRSLRATIELSICGEKKEAVSYTHLGTMGIRFI